ncbi:hypothetical protein [Pontivivens nitratireducens]|uniref:Integral membrane protein Cj1412c n=1 Tax=Pontivivens nitratireducens TaxID=2758038 RepID=A0A6G7VKX2_9RHOB|nr:hypothetical protein [Pontibrevibacter nitratireducens]QIK40498.1 hypothetical protein G8E03_06770 [Pontibrevibacter nitratireducens]
MTQTTAPPEQNVRRRAVFFIPGFDPIGARRYRELYRSQGAEQAGISGYDLHVDGKPRGDGVYGWTAELRDGGVESQADIRFLGWNDLVRDAMSDSALQAYWQMLRTAGIYIFSGALFRLIRLRTVPMVIALYPIFMLVLYFNLAFWLGTAASRLSPPGIDFVVGMAVFLTIIRLTRSYDQKNLYAFYLMSDYAFAARARGRMPEPLSRRVEEWTDLIAQRVGTVDEVLIVGHSSGAALAVHVVARLQRRGVGAVSLLTLGQVIPMVSFLPTAGDLRRDLRTVAGASDVYWLDVTAPSDGACFALVDPVATAGVAREADPNPVVISATFLRTMSEEQIKAYKRRYFRKHVQYLCAFGRPDVYDYFRITAGAMTLRARFGSRGSTASRKTAPVSGHTGVDPCP